MTNQYQYIISAGDDKTLVISVRDGLNNLIDLSTAKNIIVGISFNNVLFSTHRLVDSILDKPVSNSKLALTANKGEIQIELDNITTSAFVQGGYDFNITIVTDKNLWTAATNYLIGDIVFNVDAYYECNLDHTSAVDFATDVANWDLYTEPVSVLKYNYIVKSYMYVYSNINNKII